MSLMERLERLNLVDGQLRGLSVRVEKAKTFHRAQTKQLDLEKKRTEEAKANLLQVKASYGVVETEAKALDTQIETSRERMDTSATCQPWCRDSRDRTPTGPDSSDPLFAHAIEFVVSRSVRDAAALLDCVAGPDLGAPHLIAPPVESFLAAAKAPPRKLTIAYTEGSLLKGVDMHDENIQAARLAAERLGDLGHTLIPCPVEVDFDEFAQHINVIWCAFAAQFVQSITANVGCAADSDHFEAVTLTCAEFGRKVTSLEILDALAYVNQITRSTAQAFEEFDVLMSATVATPPPVHGTLDQNDASLSAIEWTRQTFEYANNTPLFNSTGQPAISLPLHWTTDNLPVGVQFAGRMGEEGTLLNLASQLEQACEWRSKQAALWT